MRPELKEILTNVLGVKSISEQDSAETIANWDSVRHLTLIAAIEERFDVTFDADQMLELTSVPAIVDALRRFGR
jgi:acyl carrier protein